MANLTETFTTPGTYQWMAPQGCTSVTVRLWGGGGAGEGKTAQGTGAGGAGGQYAEKVVTVTPGTIYNLVVAATKAGTTGNGTAGNDSTFNSTDVVAKGGAPGSGGVGGVGSTTGGVGTTVRKGGDGAPNNGTTSSGAGGGGAGTTADGGSASGTTAGTGSSLSGGNGGAGRTTAGNGNAGSQAGGGGGGAWRAATTNRTGGTGAAGRAELNYNYTPNAISLDGSTQYGKVLNESIFDSLNGTFTLEGWFYLDPTAAAFAYAMHLSSSSVTTGALQLENGTGNEGCNFESNYTGTSADGFISTGVFKQLLWRHVALVATLNTTTRIVINGVDAGSYNLQNTPTGSPQFDIGADFYIGKDGKSIDPQWKGKIGGFVRVWSVARTTPQLLANYQKQLFTANETGLIVNLKFGEQSGTTIANESDGTKNMALTGSPPWTSGPFVQSSQIKTLNGLALASIKTLNNLAIASVKSRDGLA